jgi:hypothetical protein
LIGFRPGPRTRAWPLLASLAPMIAIQVSRYAAGRMIVQAGPLAPSACSAAYLARCSDSGWSGAASSMDTSTRCRTPATTAAWMRARLASRSIASGLGLGMPGPTKPWTAEMTVWHPPTASATAAGSRRSPVRVCTVSGRCAARVGSRVSTRTSTPRPDRRRTTCLPSVPVPRRRESLPRPRRVRVGGGTGDAARVGVHVAAVLLEQSEKVGRRRRSDWQGRGS